MGERASDYRWMPYEQFLDNDVYFVLDQHAKLDFYSVN
jgi:hypothetical protein